MVCANRSSWTLRHSPKHRPHARLRPPPPAHQPPSSTSTTIAVLHHRSSYWYPPLSLYIYTTVTAVVIHHRGPIHHCRQPEPPLPSSSVTLALTGFGFLVMTRHTFDLGACSSVRFW
ncbi:uncharacterized protein LOC114279983 [Camellia sinensis]|uniref:uncharacterized protein LOC114279983 n=1 Tax=Camellia sinensis TaxID=4442 RepID=UPI001036633E|nr:uncharacterized protein LOC114279983 [Camellia sinensis]